MNGLNPQAWLTEVQRIHHSASAVEYFATFGFAGICDVSQIPV